jgi:hypothetical protein
MKQRGILYFQKRSNLNILPEVLFLKVNHIIFKHRTRGQDLTCTAICQKLAVFFSDGCVFPSTVYDTTGMDHCCCSGLHFNLGISDSFSYSQCRHSIVPDPSTCPNVYTPGTLRKPVQL